MAIALSAKEAMDRIVHDPPYEVILCDVMMPDVSGVDLCEQLRATHPELLERIVFITGGAFTPRARAFLEKAPNPRASKPLNAAELRTLVQKQLAAIRRTKGPR